MPKFSIISPVYNTEPYLREFLNSVVNQTFTDFELILVDDGSTDNSLEICREYAQKDSRITVLTQKNQGAGPARNNGIKHANGQYILFFDSDDWVDVQALEILNSLSEDDSADLLIFSAQEVVFDDKEVEIKRNPMISKSVEITTEQECRNIFCELIFTSVINIPWNKLFKKDIIEKYNIEFPNTRRAQDAFFNMEYYRHINSLSSVENILYYYRSNTTDKIWKKFPKDLYKIDVVYSKYLVDIFTEFGIYEGDAREKADALFFNSILRTVGFCRNPYWNLSHKEKIEYVNEIITEPYNCQRAENSLTNKRTEKIKQYILTGDSKGLLKYFYKRQRYEKLYGFYSTHIKPIIKR